MPTTGETSLPILLRTLKPTLQQETFIFATVPGDLRQTFRTHPKLSKCAEMIFYEHHRHATTLIVPAGVGFDETLREECGRCEVAFECRQITVEVHSSLAAVGFMPVLTGALAEKGISCNPVSGYYSDHLFVPVERAEEAVRVLEGLREGAKGR